MIQSELEYSTNVIQDAYHGTTLENAQTILDYGFQPKKGNELYVGDGIYFYEGSLAHAKNWAKRNKPPPIAVLRSELVLGRCLNLNNADHVELIIDTAQLFRNYQNQKKKHNPSYKNQNINRDIRDGVIINFIAKQMQIDTVKFCLYNFDDGRIFDGSKFYKSSQIIICVRNKRNISKSEIVYSEAVKL